MKEELKVSVERQLDRIDNELRITNPTSEDYKILLDRRSELLKQLESDKIDWPKWIGLGLTAVGTAVTAIATIRVPMYLGALSYANGKEVAPLVDGRMMNLATKGMLHVKGI